MRQFSVFIFRLYFLLLKELEIIEELEELKNKKKVVKNSVEIFFHKHE